jgi:hypothetical protein
MAEKLNRPRPPLVNTGNATPDGIVIRITDACGGASFIRIDSRISLDGTLRITMASGGFERWSDVSPGDVLDIELYAPSAPAAATPPGAFPVRTPGLRKVRVTE